MSTGHNNEELKKVLLSLLEHGVRKTTAQLAEELRMEYPQLWRNLEIEGEILFGSSCSSVQQPYTRISQVLLSLPPDRCLRQSINKGYCWSKP
jgi:hypothetical protein